MIVDLKIDFVKEMHQVLEIALEKKQTIEPARGPSKEEEAGLSRARVDDPDLVPEGVSVN